MKKIVLTTMLATAPILLSAQSAIDAYNLSANDLKGTARFMSMGGAFGALGGDLSTLNQNPAGIGIYRGSEIGVTLDLDIQSTKTNSMGETSNADQTKFYCNNFGYVGSVKLDSEVMPFFSWGATYSRVASFDRLYKGYIPSLSTSMTNYIADFSNGYAPSELLETSNYNPYWDSNADWLSILAYNAYMINPVGNSSTYNGLFQNGTTGDAYFNVRERGYVDEYSINFGGNITNTVYWGIGFGITDLDYINETFYDEELTNARIANANADGTVTGNAYFNIDNLNHVTGTGFNFKAGLIVKPINELRLGLAVHTPTYYDLRHEYDAVSEYSYSTGYDDWTYTDLAYFESKLNTPWRIIASAAGVFGGRAIISFDYEYLAYNDMSVKDNWGDEYDDVNSDIDNYFKASNIFRVGAEYRLTPTVSVRAGYNYQTTNVNENAADGRDYIYTSGTNPSYTFDKTTQYITCGLGYRYKGFYIDGAYVYKNRKSTFNAFSPFDSNQHPIAEVSDNNHSIVMSVGFKF